MAVQKRLALTISPDYLDLLKKVADYQKIPVSTMVMGLLEAQRPVVEAMLKAFQDIEAGKEKEQIQQNFPVRANATELLFLQHMMKKLLLMLIDSLLLWMGKS